ncbi:MAG: sensor histidine kinase [Anaerolineae bacterium]|nr:sensor histidine kinase [Gloeobacterales cyanobacterium ES-bin-313]
MFNKVESRLLLSNLAVLSSILVVFALAVYALFVQSLAAQFDERVILFAQAVSASIESENGKPQFKESIYLGSSQERIVLGETAIAQWFDLQGHRLLSRGGLPLEARGLQPGTLLTHDQPVSVRLYSQIVRDLETRKALGYVQVGLALAPMQSMIHRLAWGLAGGVTLALLLAAIGSLWLTRQAMIPIRSGYRRLQQFTADASHELRSPLTAIKLNASSAMRHSEDLSVDEIRDSFQQIQDAANDMTRLTEDLLMLARTDEDSGMPNSREILSLDSLLDTIVEQMRSVAQQKLIRLHYRAEAYPKVLADPDQLKRLFRNLIENAIQYTPPSGEVKILLQEQEHNALISVQDTGIGIAPENLTRVFDRFWRADRARTRCSGGMGLGLAIALGIVRAHGGEMNLSSKVNQGSSFVVRLLTHK